MNYDPEPGEGAFMWIPVTDDLVFVVDNFRATALIGPNRSAVMPIPTATRAEAEVFIWGLEKVTAEIEARHEGGASGVLSVQLGSCLHVEVRDRRVDFLAGKRIATAPYRTYEETRALILALIDVMDDVEARYHANQGVLDVISRIQVRAQAVQAQSPRMAAPIKVVTESEGVTRISQTRADRLAAYLRGDPEVASWIVPNDTSKATANRNLKK